MPFVSAPTSVVPATYTEKHYKVVPSVLLPCSLLFLQELDGTVQGPVLEVLVGLRAAATALQCLQAEQAALQQR
mgnify:CR=1 FL=1